MTRAAVTVVIPTHNRVHLMPASLRSVLAQRDVDLEVVVVDDGSSDATPVALEAMRDDRLRWHRNEHATGVSRARNTGVAMVETPWVAFIDDDDLWAPDKLARQLASLRLYPGARWSMVGSVAVDEELQILRHEEAPDSATLVQQVLKKNCVPAGGSGVLVSTDLVREVGGFREQFSNLADWDLWIRLAARRLRPPRCSTRSSRTGCTPAEWPTVSIDMRRNSPRSSRPTPTNVLGEASRSTEAPGIATSASCISGTAISAPPLTATSAPLGPASQPATASRPSASWSPAYGPGLIVGGASAYRESGSRRQRPGSMRSGRINHRPLLLRSGSVEQVDDDALFRLGLRGAGATAACRPLREVGRSRTAVIREARIGALAEQGLDGSRTSISDRPMQRRHPTRCGRVEVGASLREIDDDRLLSCRIPSCRPGSADHRGVERLGASPVSRPHVRATCNERPRHLDVVAERGSVQRGVAFVDLREALGQEELVTSGNPGCHQRRVLVE